MAAEAVSSERTHRAISRSVGRSRLQAGQGEWRVAQDEARQHAVAEPGAHQRHDRVVAVQREAHMGLDAVLPEQLVHFRMRAAFQLDVGLAGQRFGWEAVGVRQGMVAGHHHQQRVVHERDHVQVVLGKADGEPAVRVATPHHAFQLVLVVAAYQVQVDVRVASKKRLRDAGHPLYGRAGEGGHAYRAAFEVLAFGQLSGQVPFRIADVLHPRQERLAVGGEAHAAVFAHEQRHAQFPFERSHGVAHACLRVPQLACRLLEAAGFGGFEYRLVSLAHGPSFAVGGLLGARHCLSAS